MSQGPLCPNLSQKVQKEVSQMANRNLSCVILLGGLSVNLNHLKRKRKSVKHTVTSETVSPPEKRKKIISESPDSQAEGPFCDSDTVSVPEDSSHAL